MQTFTEVLAALGTPTELASALDLPLGTISSMKTRGSLNSRYWPKIVALATKRDRQDITLELLATIAAGRARIGTSSDEVAPTIAGSSLPHPTPAEEVA